MNIEISLRCPYDKKDGITGIDKQLALQLVAQAIDLVEDDLYVTIWRSWDGEIYMNAFNKHDDAKGDYLWQDGSWQ